jgi:hypothetical protein
MARKTKYEIERELEAAKGLLADAYAKIRKLEAEPGLFGYGGRYSTVRYVARPKIRDIDAQAWLERGAYNALLSGEFSYVEDEEHTQVVGPRDDEDFPPGVEAAIVLYTYTRDGGIFLGSVFPAVCISKA